MKKIFKLLNCLCFIVIGLSSQNSFAQSTRLLLFKDSGTFQCTATEKTHINIKTHHILVNGFCEGSPYVSKEGQIENMPDVLINHFYFDFQKSRPIIGSVDFSLIEQKGQIQCKLGHDTDRLKYGDDRFCSPKP